ncbi:MAG: flagellin, partial [Caldimicrobium sp.]
SATARLILYFYIGDSTSHKFSLTSNEVSVSVAADGSSTSNTVNLFNNLDDLITQINTQASNSNAPVVASKDNDGKLVLQTTNGETIAISAELRATISAPTGTSATVNGTINLNQLLQGASTATTGNLTSNATRYAHGIKVGDLTIGGIDNFTVQQQGMNALNATGTNITDVKRQNLNSIDVTTQEGAEKAIMIATKALQKVDTERARIGSTMNNLQSIFEAQKSAYDNTKEAESVIRNTDYAKEMADFTTYQIRMQATVAMLAQANTLPQLVLQLMR